MSERTVRTKLKALEHAGLIETQRRGSPHDSGGRATDYYRLSMGVNGNPCWKEEGTDRQDSARVTGNMLPVHIEPSKEPSFTEANASVRERKTDLVWKACPQQLVSLGLQRTRAKKLIGQWLKGR